MTPSAADKELANLNVLLQGLPDQLPSVIKKYQRGAEHGTLIPAVGRELGRYSHIRATYKKAIREVKTSPKNAGTTTVSVDLARKIRASQRLALRMLLDANSSLFKIQHGLPSLRRELSEHLGRTVPDALKSLEIYVTHAKSADQIIRNDEAERLTLTEKKIDETLQQYLSHARTMLPRALPQLMTSQDFATNAPQRGFWGITFRSSRERRELETSMDHYVQCRDSYKDSMDRFSRPGFLPSEQTRAANTVFGNLRKAVRTLAAVESAHTAWEKRSTTDRKPQAQETSSRLAKQLQQARTELEKCLTPKTPEDGRRGFTPSNNVDNLSLYFQDADQKFDGVIWQSVTRSLQVSLLKPVQQRGGSGFRGDSETQRLMDDSGSDMSHSSGAASLGLQVQAAPSAQLGPQHRADRSTATLLPGTPEVAAIQRPDSQRLPPPATQPTPNVVAEQGTEHRVGRRF